MEKHFCVYIMTNKPRGTLYIGVTSNLVQRVWQHKHKVMPGYTDKYNLDKLVYYEMHSDAENVIRREKRLKLWLRQWKVGLIEKTNGDWQDLYAEIAAVIG
ncbi:MAG: GIY-YIG nuclease family protein [Alphaproteobacteria bacterium]|nr:GIY-YIG nuclease family protein [Alphaproteobacteria bacterium]